MEFITNVRTINTAAGAYTADLYTHPIYGYLLRTQGMLGQGTQVEWWKSNAAGDRLGDVPVC